MITLTLAAKMQQSRFSQILVHHEELTFCMNRHINPATDQNSTPDADPFTQYLVAYLNQSRPGWHTKF